MPPWLGYGESALPGLQTVIFLSYSYMVERELLSHVFSCKDTNIIYEGSILMAYLPLKSLTSKYYHTGNQSFNIRIFRGYKYILLSRLHFFLLVFFVIK